MHRPLKLAETAPNEQEQGAYLLIAEDDKDVREVLRDILSPVISRILEARDGIEALQLASNHDIAVLLTDIRMRELDGLSLARKLREDGRPTPVVFLSGDSRFSREIESSLLQPCWFVPKPFSTTELREAVLHAYSVSGDKSAPRNAV